MTQSTYRVFADLNNADSRGRIRLNTVGTIEDLSRFNIELHEGLVLNFYCDDANDNGELDEIFVQGTVVYSNEEACWVAEIDWNAIRHASDMDASPVNGRSNGVAAPRKTQAG